MKLIINDLDSAPHAHAVLQQAFNLATIELGIHCLAAVVELEALPVPRPKHVFHDDSLDVYEMQAGWTRSEIKDGNVVQMGVAFCGKQQVLRSFFHELTHAAQMLRGDLQVHDKKAYWRGVNYPEPSNQQEYEALPWEVEARAQADRIMAKFQAKEALTIPSDRTCRSV
jgi:hypothetical protein